MIFLSFLTISSLSFFDVAQSNGGGGGDSDPPVLHNFLSFNPNLMKLLAIMLFSIGFVVTRYSQRIHSLKTLLTL